MPACVQTYLLLLWTRESMLAHVCVCVPVCLPLHLQVPRMSPPPHSRLAVSSSHSIRQQEQVRAQAAALRCFVPEQLCGAAVCWSGGTAVLSTDSGVCCLIGKSKSCCHVTCAPVLSLCQCRQLPLPKPGCSALTCVQRST